MHDTARRPSWWRPGRTALAPRPSYARLRGGSDDDLRYDRLHLRQRDGQHGGYKQQDNGHEQQPGRGAAEGAAGRAGQGLRLSSGTQQEQHCETSHPRQ